MSFKDAWHGWMYNHEVPDGDIENEEEIQLLNWRHNPLFIKCGKITVKYLSLIKLKIAWNG